jgi:hypothetical protein
MKCASLWPSRVGPVLPSKEYVGNPIDSKTEESLLIIGITHFIIRNEDTKKKVEFSGAQPVETFLDAFEELGGEGLELQ